MWDRLIGILCAMALVGLILPSYWPSPSRGEPIRIDQSNSAQSKQPTGSDPSEAPPEAFPVKVFPAPKSAAQSEREHQESDRKAANEGALTTATEVIAVLTGVLALIAISQAGLFVWQLRMMRRDFLEKGEREGPFLEPIIEFDSGQYKWLEWYSHPTSPVNPVHAEVSFKIRNFGNSPALLRSVAVDISHLTEMVPTPRVDMLADYAVEPIIDTKSVSEQEFKRQLAIPIDKIGYISIKKEQSHLFLFGEICFSDIVGADYIQTFCFAYSFKARRFIRWAAKYNKRHRQEPKK